MLAGLNRLNHPIVRVAPGGDYFFDLAQQTPVFVGSCTLFQVLQRIRIFLTCSHHSVHVAAHLSGGDHVADAHRDLRQAGIDLLFEIQFVGIVLGLGGCRVRVV